MLASINTRYEKCMNPTFFLLSRDYAQRQMMNNEHEYLVSQFNIWAHGKQKTIVKYRILIANKM